MALKKVLKSLIFFQFVQFSYQVPAVSSKIKTVVVTVLENRSFDSVAGFFDYDEKIDGILKITPCYNAVANNTNSQKFCVAKGLKNYVPFGPNHSVQGADHQIFGSNIRQDIPASELPSSPPMNGFLENNLNNFDVKDAQSYVSSFDPKTIPVITTLAKEFALFNRWFSSIPGPTQPNRAFVHSNTAAGMSDNDEKKMIAGYDQRNLYDILMENGYTVGNYWGEIPTFLTFKSLRDLNKLNMYKHMSLFEADAKSGKLPNFSFIDPNYGEFSWNNGRETDGHADFFSSYRGSEILLKNMYESLRASPQWENLAWIITFDEHGGWHDHVPTPMNVPRPDNLAGKDGFLFDRLGVRVPAIVVSPHVQKGRVVVNGEGKPTPSSEFEHSSIAATVLKLFGINESLTKRTDWASKFDFLFNEGPMRNDCPVQLPPVHPGA